MRYGYILFQSEFEVKADGGVKMLNDEKVTVGGKLVVYRPYEVPRYSAPFRLARFTNDWSDFDARDPPVEGEEAKRMFEREVPDWTERVVRHRLEGVLVDLRDARCGTLNDNAGKVWESAQPVKLEEFKYAETFLPDDVSVQNEVDVRLAWLRGGSRGQTVSGRCIAALRRYIHVFGAQRLLALTLRRRDGWWTEQGRQFRAQPYTHLASVLRERGDDEAARDVEAEKIRWGAYDRARNGMGGRLLLLFWWWPYGLLFRYGLAPVRAFFTLLGLWLIGFLAISMLSENGMLYANVNLVAPAALKGGDGPTPVVPTPTAGYSKIFPCGDAIAPALYAADLLTPILNLHQESRCDIRASQPEDGAQTILTFHDRPIRHFRWMVLPRPWEYLKAAYILIGSVVSSLALLTFSGIARRWEH